ncbi:MAG: DUF6383 domain-containing protein [Parabacteroides gordonii]|nr:DUF6383 domain-containing protein [Parabacteroides gordonii]
MKTTFTRMVYRCLLITVVCCVLPLIGSTYAWVAAQQPDPPTPLLNVTITEPTYGGGTFTATYPPGNTLQNGENTDIPKGTVLTLTATPDRNYRFVKFTADDVEISSPYTETSHVTLSVEFEPIPVIPDPPASVTITQPATGGTFKAAKEDGTELSDGRNPNCYTGDVLTLTEKPDPGYRLVKFTANGTEVSSPYTVVPGQVTISAEFEQILHTVTIAQPEWGTITATTGDGTVLLNGANAVAEGTVLTLTNTPNYWYNRFNWYTANDRRTTSPYTITSDVTLSAIFDPSPKPSDITIVQPATGGTFTATYPPANTLQNGENKNIPPYTVVTLTATPDEGYEFVKFTEYGEEITSPYTVPPNTDIIFSAEFVQLHTVTITQPAEGGTFTATYPPGNTLQNGANTDIPEGTILTLTPASATGYRLVKFTADGAEVSSPYTVTGNITLSAEFEQTSSPPTPPTPPSPPVDPGDDTPTVYYIVTLPAVEGATTDPVAGSYKVESWSNFRFFLTLDKEYDKSEPVVTTSGGTTIIPHTGNGAYIIENIRQPLEIRIDGIVKNPDPVANETVKTNQSKVWAAEGHLHIEVATDGQAYIFTADGKLQKMQPVTAGETITLPLPEGVYIVRIGDERFKVLL